MRSAKIRACSLKKAPLSIPSAWVGWVVANRTGVDRSVSAKSNDSNTGESSERFTWM